MKKLLNKLFKWLGYVPKEEYKPSRELLLEHEYMSLTNAIVSGTIVYKSIKIGEIINIVATAKYNDLFIPIKIIHDIDKEYMELCAEELCEKLNERI